MHAPYCSCAWCEDDPADEAAAMHAEKVGTAILAVLDIRDWWHLAGEIREHDPLVERDVADAAARYLLAAPVPAAHPPRGGPPREGSGGTLSTRLEE